MTIPFKALQLRRLLPVSILALTFAGCAGEKIQTTQIPPSADPNAEIAQLDSDMHSAGTDQVNVLAPHNYALADKAVQEAKNRRSQNKPNSEILEKVAEGRAYLKQAEDKSQIAKASLGHAVKARADAIASTAPTLFPSDFNKADDDLIGVTQDIEKGDASRGERERERLYTMYRTLEVRGVQQARLGDSLKTLKQAQDEGAKQWAPKSLAAAEKSVGDAQSVIANDPQNEQIASLAANAKRDTQNLLDITRKSKLVKNRNPEETAMALEKQQEEIAEAGKEVETRQDTIAEQNKRLTTLEEDKLINERFKRVSERFDPSEADVFRTDSHIVIRLKGLNFPVAGAEIPSKDFALLKKVDDALADVPAKSVTVEGNTDDTGSREANLRLSEERAEAVKDFLVSGSNTLSEDKVTVEGKGFSQPLASNRTKEGRALNRRVDIVIEG